MIRRLAGLILCGLMLQLNLRASDLVCAKHDGKASTVTAGSGQNAGMSMTEQHHQQGAGEKKSCEIPVTKDCCQAVASCAMTLGLGARISAASFLPDHGTTLPLRADAPSSPVSSPEPPPPKL